MEQTARWPQGPQDQVRCSLGKRQHLGGVGLVPEQTSPFQLARTLPWLSSCSPHIPAWKPCLHLLPLILSELDESVGVTCCTHTKCGRADQLREASKSLLQCPLALLYSSKHKADGATLNCVMGLSHFHNGLERVPGTF